MVAEAIPVLTDLGARPALERARALAGSESARVQASI